MTKSTELGWLFRFRAQKKKFLAETNEEIPSSLKASVRHIRGSGTFLEEFNDLPELMKVGASLSEFARSCATKGFEL